LIGYTVYKSLKFVSYLKYPLVLLAIGDSICSHIKSAPATSHQISTSHQATNNIFLSQQISTIHQPQLAEQSGALLYAAADTIALSVG